MKIDTANITANWKTTVQPVLSGIIGLAAIAPTLSALSPKQAAWLISAGAVAKMLIGLTQQDAGKTMADTPSGLKAVDSHEVPDDENNQAVGSK